MYDFKDPLLEGLISDVQPTFSEESFRSLIRDVLDGEEHANRTYLRVGRIYGEDVAKALALWLQSEGGDLKNGTSKNNYSTSEVFDLLTKRPTQQSLRILKSTIGGGSSGVAILLKDGRVFKKLFSDFEHQENAEFYRYAMKHRPSVFLEVLKIGKDYVISKEVKAASPKCRDYSRKIQEAMRNARAHGEVDLYAADAKFADYLDDLEVAEWSREVGRHLGAVGLDFSDLKAANLGETKDGRILMIDP